jgi:hypothetical protein
VNIDAILNNLDSLCGFEHSTENKYEGPTFFLNGELSVKYEDSVYL